MAVSVSQKSISVNQKRESEGRAGCASAAPNSVGSLRRPEVDRQCNEEAGRMIAARAEIGLDLGIEFPHNVLVVESPMFGKFSRPQTDRPFAFAGSRDFLQIG